jgi:glutathione S-transferase
MKLYYAPGACSLAAHITLNEAGQSYSTKRVDLKTHTLADGTDYYTINPKGYVPVLELDDGSRLSEAAVILQYIADRKPGTLAPAFGSMERYRLMEWLNFIATEVHKNFSPLWHPVPDATRETLHTKIASRLDFVSKVLSRQPYLMGEKFTIADAYLFTIVNWAPMLKFDLAPWPVVQQFHARVAARPGVRAAMVDEGLVKKTQDPAKATA